MKDRRHFIRIPRKGLIKFREMHLPRNLITDDASFYTNISPGGILFESAHYLGRGTMLKLEIELKDWDRCLPESARLPAGGAQPLRLLGEVVHCSEINPQNGYNIGVKFVNLDPRYQEALLRCLQNHAGQHD
jgi:hypothetical protein